jgi:RND family efflux transporter MFP subunit
VATVIDRRTVRVIGEVPEADFEVVAPTTPVRVQALATRRDLRATIARRSPAADAATRTVHLEIDVPDPDRALPVGTTAELTVDVGKPANATEVPLIAAAQRGNKATIYVIDGGVAHKSVFAVLGEREGNLYLEPTLRAGSHVVTEGRGLLKDGDRVEAKLEVMHTMASDAGGDAIPGTRL